MNAPQVIVIVLLAIRLGVHAANDRKPIDPQLCTYSFGRALFTAGIWAGLLWWGGFFAGGVA